MTGEGAPRLSLRDSGWAKLDSATLAVSGEVARIISEMQRVVDDDVVVSLCEKLGVCSTAFLFHDTIKSETRFLREDHSPPTYQTQYLWSDGQAHKDWSDCLQWLFVKVRGAQYDMRRGGDEFGEDYFVNIPGDEKWRDLGGEAQFRESHGIHYCTVGETLFTIFAWRALCGLVESGQGELGEGILLLEQSSWPKRRAAQWLGAPVASGSVDDAGGGGKGASESKVFRDLWGSKIGPQDTWHAEWPRIFATETARANREAVLHFLERAGCFGEIGGVDVDDDESLNRVFQAAIVPFITWLTGCAPSTTMEALRALEVHARFPILPFYFWSALNGAPMCYMVAPVWTSQHYAIQVPGGKCRHLGLALTGVRPLLEADWTIDANSGPCSDAEIALITSLLRLMARPLVESNLYHWLYREVLEGKVDRAVQRKWKGMAENESEPNEDRADKE